MMRGFAVMFCIVLAEVVAGGPMEDCSDLDLKVTYDPDRSYKTQNVTLFCKAYTNDAYLVNWHLKSANASVEKVVYTAYPMDDSRSQPAAGYEDSVRGSFITSSHFMNHSLTLLEAGEQFQKSTWYCRVRTATCPIGKDSNQVLVTLKDGFFGGPRLRYDNGADVVNGTEVFEDSIIVCETRSIPAAVVSLFGEGVEIHRSLLCEPDATGAWICSVHAKLVKSGIVVCRAVYLGNEYCAGGNCSFFFYFTVVACEVGVACASGSAVCCEKSYASRRRLL